MSTRPSDLVDFRTLLAELLSTPTRRRPYTALGADLLKGVGLENILSQGGQTAIPLAQSGGEAPRSTGLRLGQGLGSQIAQQATRTTVQEALEPELQPEQYVQRIAARQATALSQEQTRRTFAARQAEQVQLQGLAVAMQSPDGFRSYLSQRAPGLGSISDRVFQIITSLAPRDPETADKIIGQIVAEQAKTNIATLEPVFFGEGAAGATTPSAGVDLSRLLPATRQALGGLPATPGGPRVAEQRVPGAPGQFPPEGGPGPAPPAPLGLGGPSAGPLSEGTRLLQQRVDDYASAIEGLESGIGDPVKTLADAESRGNALGGLVGENHPLMQDSRNRVINAAATSYQGKLRELVEAQQRGAWDVAVPALADVRALYMSIRASLPEPDRVQQDRMLATLADRQKELWISGEGGTALGIVRPWRWGDVERVVGATMQGALIASLVRVAAPLVGAGIGFVVGGPPGAVAGSLLGHTLGQAAMPLVMAGSAIGQIAVPETEGVMSKLALGGVVATPAALPFIFAAPPLLALASRAFHGLEEGVTGTPSPLFVKGLQAGNALEAANELINEWHDEPAPFLLKLGAELVTGGTIWHGLKIPFTGLRVPGMREMPPVSTAARGLGKLQEYAAERSGLRARQAERYLSLESFEEIKNAREEVRVLQAQIGVAEARGEDLGEYTVDLSRRYADIRRLENNWEMRNRVMLSVMPERLEQHLLRVYDDADPARKGVLAALAEPWLLLGHHAFEGQIKRMGEDRAAIMGQIAAEARWFRERHQNPTAGLYATAETAVGEVKPEDIVRTVPPPEVLAMEMRKSGVIRGDFSSDAVRENLRWFGFTRTAWADQIQRYIDEQSHLAGFEKPRGERGDLWRTQEPLIASFIQITRNNLDAARQIIRAHAEETKQRTGEEIDVPRWDSEMRDLTQTIHRYWEEHTQAVRLLRRQALAEGGWDYDRFDAELRRRVGPAAERLKEQERQVQYRWATELGERQAPVPGVPPEAQPETEAPIDFRPSGEAERLLFGREPGRPIEEFKEPAPPPAAPPETAAGPPPTEAPRWPTTVETVAYGPEGKTASSPGYALRYKVVSLDELVPSHTIHGTPREDHPGELQIRGGFNIIEATNIGKNLTPEWVLAETSRLAEGAPIVRRDNIAINNHRIVGFQLARESYPEKWQAYQDALKSRTAALGISAEALQKIKDPVLVREVVNEADIPTIVDLANIPTVQRYSPSALAMRDARFMSDEMLALLRVTEKENLRDALLSPKNTRFMNAFTKPQIIPQAEVPNYVTGGKFTPAGVERVENALLAKVLGENGREIVQRFADMEGETERTLYNGVMAALPRLARAEGAARSGQRDPSLAIGHDLAVSLRAYTKLRDSGLTVEQAAAQIHMFTGQALLDFYALTPVQRALLLHLEQIARSGRSVKAFLDGYAKRVMEPSSRLAGTTSRIGFLRELGVNIPEGVKDEVPPEAAVRGAPTEPGASPPPEARAGVPPGPAPGKRAAPPLPPPPTARRPAFAEPEEVDIALVTDLDALVAYGQRDRHGQRPLVLWARDELGPGFTPSSTAPRLEARSLETREWAVLLPTLGEAKAFKGTDTEFTNRYGNLLAGRNVIVDPVQDRNTAARYAQHVFDLGGQPVHPVSRIFEWVPGALMARAGGRGRLRVNRGEDATLYLLPTPRPLRVQRRRERALRYQLEKGKIDQPTFEARMRELTEMARTAEAGKESYDAYRARVKAAPPGQVATEHVLESPWQYWEKEKRAIDQELRYIHRQARAGESSPEDLLALQKRRGLIEMLMTTLADVPMNAEHIRRITETGIDTEGGLLADALNRGRISPDQAAQLGSLESRLSRLIWRRGLQPIYPIGAERAKAWDTAMFGDGAPVDRAGPRGSGPLTAEQEALLSATTDSNLPPELTEYRSPVAAAFPEIMPSGLRPVMPPSLSQIYRETRPVVPAEIAEWMVQSVRYRGLEPVQAEAATRGLRALRSELPVFLLNTATGTGKTFIQGAMMAEMARDPNSRSVYVATRQDQLIPVVAALNDMAVAAKLDQPIDVGIIQAQPADLKRFEGLTGVRVRSLAFGEDPAQVTLGTPSRFREGAKANDTLLHPSITSIFLDEAHIYGKHGTQRGDFVQRDMYQAHGWNDAQSPRRAGLVLSTATPYEYLDDFRLYRPLLGMFSRQEWDAYETALRSGRPAVNREVAGAPFNRSLPHGALWALGHQIAAAGRSFAFDTSGGERFIVERLRAPADTLQRYDDLAGVVRDVRALAYEVAHGGEMTSPFLNTFERIQASMRWDLATQIAEKALTGAEPRQVIFLTRSISGETAAGGFGRTAIASLRAHISDKVTVGREALLDRLDELTRRYENAIGNIGLSPRELVLRHFASRGVADLTGQRSVKERAVLREKFQRGDLAVAVVSDSESTAIDLHHAHPTARPRVVIPMSVDWSASTFVQRLGRMRRWGQLSAPEYRILSLAEDLPTEQRFVGGLVQRLESMGAAVLGNPKSYVQDDTLDLFAWRPDLARQAVATTLARNPDLAGAIFGSSAKMERFVSSGTSAERYDVQDFLNGLLFLPRDQAKMLLDQVGWRMAMLRDDVGEAALRSVPLKSDWVRLERNVVLPDGKQMKLSVVHDGMNDHLILDHQAVADPALAASLDLPTSRFFSGWVAGGERDHRTVAGIAVGPRNALSFLERRLSPVDAAAVWEALSPLFKLEAVLQGGPRGHVLVLQHPELGNVALGPPPGALNIAFPHARHMRAAFPQRWLAEHRDVLGEAVKRAEVYVARAPTQEGAVEFFVPIETALRWAEQGNLILSDLAGLEPGRRTGFAHPDPTGFFTGIYEQIIRSGEERMATSTAGVPLDLQGVPSYVTAIKDAQVRFGDLSQKALDAGQADDAAMYANFAAFMGKESVRYARYYAEALPQPLQDGMVESWANLRHMLGDRERLAEFLVNEAGLEPEAAGRFSSDFSTFGMSLLREVERGSMARSAEPLGAGEMADLHSRLMELGGNLYAEQLGFSGTSPLSRHRPNGLMESSSWMSAFVLQQIMRTPSMLLHIVETQAALYALAQAVNPMVFVPKRMRARLPFLRSQEKQMPDAGEIDAIMGQVIGSDNRGPHAFTLQTGVAGIERDPLADVAAVVSATVSGLFGHGADAARQLTGAERKMPLQFRERWEYWRRRHRGENDERAEVRGFIGQVMASWPEWVTGKVIANVYGKVEETSRLGFFYRWFPSFHDRALFREEYGAGAALWRQLSQPKDVPVGTLEPRLRNAALHWLHAARGGKSVSQVFDQVRRDFGIKADDPAAKILDGWQNQATKAFLSADDFTLMQWLSSQKFADRMVAEDMRNSFLIRTNNTMIEEWARRVFPFWNYEVQSPWLWARAYAKNPVLFGVYNGWYEEQERQKRRMLGEPERYKGFQTAWTPAGPVAFNPLVGTYPSKLYRYAVGQRAKDVYDPFDEVSSIAQHFFVPHPLAGLMLNVAAVEGLGKETVAPAQLMAYEPILAALAQMTSGSNAGFPVISTVQGWLRQVASGYDHNPYFENDVNRLLAEKGVEPNRATEAQRSQAIREAALWQMARLLTGYRVKRYDQFEVKELGSLATDLQQMSQFWQVDTHVSDTMTVQDMWNAFRKLPQGLKRDLMERHPLLVPYLQVGLAFASPSERDVRTRELRAMAAYEAWRKAVVDYNAQVDQSFGMVAQPDGRVDFSRADVRAWKNAMRSVAEGRPEELQQKRKEILLQYGFSPSAFGDMRELARMAYQGMNPESQVLANLPPTERRLYEERLKRRPELASMHPWDAAFEQYMEISPENKRYWLDESGGAINYDLLFRERKELLKMLSPETSAYVEQRAQRNSSHGQRVQRQAMDAYRQALLPRDEGGDGIPRFLGVPKDHERAVLEARSTISKMRELAGNALAAGNVEQAKFWRERLVRYQSERIRTLRVDIRRVRRHPLFKRWLGQHPEITAFLDLPEAWMEKSLIAEGELQLAAS